MFTTAPAWPTTWAPSPSAGSLTASTLTGLDMPAVSEVQTFRVQAKSGTYRLGLDAAVYAANPGVYGPAQTITYDPTPAGAAAAVLAVQDALRRLYGTQDLVVQEVSREVPAGQTDAHAITYAVTFIRSRAGIDLPQVVWADSRADAALTLFPNDQE